VNVPARSGELGDWVSRQRKSKRDGELSKKRILLLAKIGFDWSPPMFPPPRKNTDDDWFAKLEELREYYVQHRSVNVPSSWATGLGNWVYRQRKTKNTMSPERKAQLERLPGWSWDASSETMRAFSKPRKSDSDKWEKGFSCLSEFIAQEGHAMVPKDYKTVDGYRLGQWSSGQRKVKDAMSPERKARLESLPGWCWNLLSGQWEKGFRYLNEFTCREGTANVLMRYKTEDGYPIGSWVATQRATKDTMSLECKVRLEALPGWSWDANSDKWEAGFRCLQKFVDQEGHARVAQDFRMNDEYPLGSWVSVQRKAKEKISMERKARLEALPGWVWRADKK
jgi:hypothetical protein